MSLFGALFDAMFIPIGRAGQHFLPHAIEGSPRLKSPMQSSNCALFFTAPISILVTFSNHSNAMEDQAMIIGDRLRELREEKKPSQGDIEKKTGLLRCYISRIENGHSVPAIETLEKLARALDVPMYQLFYDGEEPPKLPNLLKRKSADDIVWGSKGKDARMLVKFCRLFGRMKEDDRGLVLSMAQKMAQRKAV
jgi:transcriptional regulator with XRE-family HTH domain